MSTWEILRKQLNLTEEDEQEIKNIGKAMENMMEFFYYAVFDYADDGINIFFPDVPEALSCADDDAEAEVMAEEVLGLCLHGRNIQELPVPSLPEHLNIASNQKLVKINAYLEIRYGKLFSEDVIEFEDE